MRGATEILRSGDMNSNERSLNHGWAAKWRTRTGVRAGGVVAVLLVMAEILGFAPKYPRNDSRRRFANSL
jgi:hypothetical protein